MARKTSAPLLDSGDAFPALELTLTDGGRLHLPADLSRPYNVVLVNRGAWCPFCVAQLRGFQLGLARLADEGIGVVSGRVQLRRDRAAGVAGRARPREVPEGARLRRRRRSIPGWTMRGAALEGPGGLRRRDAAVRERFVGLAGRVACRQLAPSFFLGFR